MLDGILCIFSPLTLNERCLRCGIELISIKVGVYIRNAEMSRCVRACMPSKPWLKCDRSSSIALDWLHAILKLLSDGHLVCIDARTVCIPSDPPSMSCVCSILISSEVIVAVISDIRCHAVVRWLLWKMLVCTLGKSGWGCIWSAIVRSMA